MVGTRHLIGLRGADPDRADLRVLCVAVGFDNGGRMAAVSISLSKGDL
jgi:hypothetical protein